MGLSGVIFDAQRKKLNATIEDLKEYQRTGSGPIIRMRSLVWSQVGQQSPNLFCDLSRVVILNPE